MERSQVQEAIQDNSSVSPGKALSSAFSNCYLDLSNHASFFEGNYNTDASQLIQPFPSVPCLPISDPKTPGPNIPQTYADPDSWMDDVCNNESYPGSDLDRDLDACQKTDEGVLFMAPDTVSLGTPQPVAGIMSPAESISTPGLDGGASSYSTPSTMYYGSPEMGDRPVPGLAATIFNQAAETTSLISNRSMQSSTMPVATGSNQTILHFLQSYIVAQGPVQKEKRIQKVLQAEVHLITQDPCEMLRPLLGEWDDNILRGLHALGLPAVWKGIQGAVDYIRVLDADEAKPFLDPVARRIAQVLLSFNYAKLCGSQSKSDATPVLNCILDAYPDDPRISMSRQSRRNKISGYHVRRGRWWWKLAGTLGVGILLICDSSLTSIMYISQLAHYVAQLTQMSRCNNSFTNNQIDVLATFALNTRPGTIRVFRALESLVKSLMFGRVTDDLRHAILNDGLLSRHEMERAQNEDEVAVACQQIETPWTVVDVESCATKEMAEFLTSVPAT